MGESELSIETETLPGSQVGLTIQVPQARVDAAYEQVLSRLVSRARIEGFRPGRAPRALVEARLGPALIRDEVIESLVPAVVRQALEERSIDAIDTPRVDVLELERGRPASFKARVSVMPEITLPALDQLQVSVPSLEVNDEMVEQRLVELREPLAEVTPVEREVRLGDLVVADLEVEVEGRKVQEKKADEFEVKEGAIVAEVLAVLPGARVDQTVEVERTLPADDPDPELAGKAAHYRLTIRGVKEKKLAELTDEVAKQLSDGKQESVVALREKVRSELEQGARELSDLARDQALLKALVEGALLTVPQALVEHELTHQLETLEVRLQRQGLRLDRYLAYNNLTADRWMEQARPDAESRLRVDLVLNEVARKEGLDPSEDEVSAFMREQAEKDEEVRGALDELLKSRSARDYFRVRLQRLRVLKHLQERVKERSAEPVAAAPGAAEERGG